MHLELCTPDQPCPECSKNEILPADKPSKKLRLIPQPPPMDGSSVFEAGIN